MGRGLRLISQLGLFAHTTPTQLERIISTVQLERHCSEDQATALVVDWFFADARGDGALRGMSHTQLVDALMSCSAARVAVAILAHTARPMQARRLFPREQG